MPKKKTSVSVLETDEPILASTLRDSLTGHIQTFGDRPVYTINPDGSLAPARGLVTQSAEDGVVFGV